jgi:hypothetical protein
VKAETETHLDSMLRAILDDANWQTIPEMQPEDLYSSDTGCVRG